jgi:hypothetical protein
MLRRFRTWFVATGERIESWPLPSHRLALLFLAVLAIRLTLEFFSSHRLYTIDDVIHIGLWFAFVVLAFTLLLQVATGASMLRTARLTIGCYVFSWSAPIIDLIVHRGVPVRMNYIAINDWGDFAQAWLTFGGPSIMRGATLGIRIEIALLVLACFLHVHARRGSVLRAAAAALAIYSMLFLTGAIPFLLGLIVSALGLRYAADDQSTVLLLCCMDAALLLLALWRAEGRVLQRALAGVCWPALLVGVAAFAIGAWLAHAAYPDNVTWHPTTLFWPPMLAWMTLGFAAWLGTLGRDHGGSAALRAATWVLVAAGALLIDARFAFAVQLVFAVVWLRLDLLRAWRSRLLDAIAGAGILLSAALAGFQCLGGPMIGLPTPWLAGFALIGATLGAMAVRGSERRDDVITSPDGVPQ